jgi:intracellular multiplication protein IcmQ
MNGNDLRQWENQLASILKIAQSRPIYSEEVKVMNVLRSNLDRLTDAYIKVIVDKRDIIDSARIVKDRLGQELVTVSVTAIRPENVIEFVHQRKKYSFVHGKLVIKAS